MSCQEEVTVTLPPRAELKLTTHLACWEMSLWPKMPQCLSCSGTGTCLCCTHAGVCRLKTADEIDNFADGHGKGYCCSLNQLKGQDWKEATCISGSERRTTWFCIEVKQNYECRLWPTTCCKYARQDFCCDTRVALPFDEQVPFACAICGKWLSGEPERIQDWRVGPASQDMGGPRQVVARK